MKLLLLPLLLALSTPAGAAGEEASHQLPAEIITAPRLTSFSQRSGGWPHSILQKESIPNEPRSWWSGWDEVEGVSGRTEGSPAISLRGSVKADRALLLWDGIPLNLADGFGASELLVPTEVITSTRVFKGPASAFYGRSALGGVVLGESQLAASPRAQLAVGSFGTSSLSNVLPWSSERSRSQASVLLHQTKGDFPYEMKSNSRSGTREHNRSELQRYTLLGQSGFGSWSIEHRLLYARKKGDYPGRIDEPETAFTPANGLLDRQGGLGSLRVVKKWGDDQSLTWTGAVIRSDLISDPHSPLASDSRTDRSYQELFLERRVNDLWKYNVFVDHSIDEFAASYFTEPTFHNGEVEGGVSLEVPLSNTVNIQPAVRYLDEYRRGLAAFGFFQKDERFESWMTYGQGFRAPSLTDRFCNNAFCLGNRSLKPESGDQIEIGFATSPATASEPDPTLLYGLSVFQISHRDYLSFANVGAQTQTINSGRAQIFGGDAFAELQQRQIHWRLGMSHLDAENLSTRQRLLMIPEWSGQLRASVTKAAWGGYAQVRYWGSYLDQQDTSSPLRELGKAWFADAGLAWRRNAWSLELAARNLFDQPLERRVGYPDPQREWTLSLRHQD